jgi:hypothetical protein
MILYEYTHHKSSYMVLEHNIFILIMLIEFVEIWLRLFSDKLMWTDSTLAGASPNNIQYG